MYEYRFGRFVTYNAARGEDAADLVQARVGIVDVLEHAAGEHRVEPAVLERKLYGIWAQVSLDLGKALQRLDGQGRNALAVVERDRVDSARAAAR